MIVRSFDDSETSGFDIRSYKPIGNEFTNTAVNTGTNILSVTGEGYIDTLLFRTLTLSNTGSIKIIIDGAYYTFPKSNLDVTVGFLLNDLLAPIYNSTSTQYQLLTRCPKSGTDKSSIVQYLKTFDPSITGNQSQNYTYVSSIPIFFETSCSVTISNTTSDTVFAVVSGGVKI